MRAVSIIVRGKVQGVYFRHATQMKAEELGLNGIVKNLPTGEVYIEAEGDAEQVDTFIDWCRDEGSYSSIVMGVKVEDQKPKGFTRFEILR